MELRAELCGFFTPQTRIRCGQFMHGCSIVAIDDMNTTFLPTRDISLALLVTAVVEHHQSSSAANIAHGLRRGGLRQYLWIAAILPDPIAVRRLHLSLVDPTGGS